MGFQFHPLVSQWFASRFPKATEVQLRAWAAIQSGRDALISAPTGSGKTLAAFLGGLDRLVHAAAAGSLTDAVDVLYISPLKALSTDVRRNLSVPLAEISALAGQRGASLQEIRAMVRTGDTSPQEREKMRRQPPHVLVTTPESLFILLTASRSREALRTVRTVIVDEIHAVADDKRGAHLALSLARLDELVTRSGHPRPQRVGLSATVQPIDLVARFLAPVDEGGCAAPVEVVDSGHRRAVELAVEVPRDELGAVASAEMWNEIYDRLGELIRSHRTTLVFVNTRRLAERVAHHLGARIGAEAVLAHHGSLSRSLRQSAEERLKNGELRAVVATASLELGIDIGSVDLACQIGSPRSIAITLQRIGRSGHQVEPAAIPKGRLFATTRDELIECAALVRAMRSGTLDQLEVPSAPLDVLAQQIVAAAACDDWAEADLYRLVRRTFSYRGLERADFDAVITMLSEGIASRRGRRGAYLLRDQVHGIVRARRGARLAAITSGGAIPENASYYVIAEPDEAIVGTLDEDFAVESLAGDIFLLGTTSWRIKRVEAGRVRVENAHGAPPTIPFWRGEAPGRTTELSAQVSRLREDILARQQDGVPFLAQECGLDRRGAEQVVEYVARGATALGALPTQTTIVAERFFDEGGGMQLVLHAPFGARVNRAWGLALRKRFCRSFNFELQAAATDNGIIISLSDQHSFPLELVYRFLRPETAEDVLTQALLDAPMFTARWRWNASRALAVLRFANGRKVPPPIQRMRSDDLLASVFPDQVACAENLVGEIRIPDHPLVKESIGDCLREAMDIDGLKTLLRGIEGGTVKTVAIDTVEPSPFSHEILNANPYAYLDDAPLEERRARAVLSRRGIGAETGPIAALDPDAIARVESEAWPMVRDPNELHDALQTLGVTPPIAEWEEFFATLTTTARATSVIVRGRRLWVAAERLSMVRAAYLEFDLDPPIRAAGEKEWSAEDAIAATVCGWLDSTGPRTARELADLLALPIDRIEAALLALEGQGLILRGRFRTSQASAPESPRRAARGAGVPASEELGGVQPF
ncbi:MAG: DEAD/DEAH box helicase, partial [Acidobacteria bacterium]|nr:DEAD/DEAH box helicase [Acidobacteriota bacterium]